jgi:hypothetical protein
MGNYHAPFGKRTMEKGLHQQVPRQRPTSLPGDPGAAMRRGYPTGFPVRHHLGIGPLGWVVRSRSPMSQVK